MDIFIDPKYWPTNIFLINYCCMPSSELIDIDESIVFWKEVVYLLAICVYLSGYGRDYVISISIRHDIMSPTGKNEFVRGRVCLTKKRRKYFFIFTRRCTVD